MIKLINTTPHAVRLNLEGTGTTLCLPTSGMKIRVTQEQGPVLFEITEHAGHALLTAIPVRDSSVPKSVVMIDEKGEEHDLPAMQENVYFIVSLTAGKALRNRRDILLLGTADADHPIRDEKGRIIAVRCLKFP
jgi:hypothetical protein